MEDKSLAEVYPYHIIEFINIGRKPKIKKIDIVATKWLDYNDVKKKCTVLYPPPPYNEKSYESYNAYLSSLGDALSDWISYPVAIKGRAKLLSEAFQKCQQLNEKESALTLESEGDDFYTAEQKAINSFKKEKLRAISDSMKNKILNPSMDTNYNQYSNQFISDVSTNNSLKENKENYSGNKGKFNQIEKKLPVNISSKNKYKSLDSREAKLDLVLEQIIEIKSDIKQLKKDYTFIMDKIQQLKTLQQKMIGVTEKDFCASIIQIQEKYKYIIPFETINEFNAFDQDLRRNESLSNDVDNVLQTGLDPSNIVSKSIVNMLKMFLTKQVAMQYVAVRKKANKQIMKTTVFYNKIEVLIKRKREIMGLLTNDKEMLTALSNVLCNAGSWYKIQSQVAIEEERDENCSPNTAQIMYQPLIPENLPKIIATGVVNNGVVDIAEGIDIETLTENEDNTDSEEINNVEYLQQFMK